MRVFIAGPRLINDLDENITEKLNSICDKGYNILVGDASGIDSLTQKFLAKRQYKSVQVYSSNGRVRNNYGNWKIKNVKVDSQIQGFEFYAQKDIKMVEDCDIGFMIWNGESKGTFNNILNLLNSRKSVVLYFVNYGKFYLFNELNEFIIFLDKNVKLNSKLKKIMNANIKSDIEQVCIF